MSGHSKWAQIKRGKEVSDKKKGILFSKLSKAISIAAREGGEPEMNFKLRMAVEQAKAANMPKENIERAIKRGTGEVEGEKIEEMIYGAFGPGGVALVIEVVTDNKNRAISELKRILNKYKGRLVESGSVLWMFERRGIIRLNLEGFVAKYGSREEGELRLIDLGAEDVKEENNELAIYTRPENLGKMKETLVKEGVKVEYLGLEYVPKEKKEIKDQKTRETIERLFEELDEAEDVGDYYSNL
jgi:YebC/PmpR family DNA-binding regulatory protein